MIFTRIIFLVKSLLWQTKQKLEQIFLKIS